MYYTYVLLMSNGLFYIGFSNNLKRRIQEHHAGKDATTKRFLPVRLIFYECFLAEEDARRREMYFKTSKGKSTLRQMLRKTLTK